MQIRQNMQVHTTASGCAKPDMEIQAIVNEAAAHGLRLIGLTDHLNTPDQWPIPGQVKARLADVDVPEGLTVLVGCEAQMTAPNDVSITQEEADACQVVLIACNHYHLRSVEKPDDKTPAGWADHHLRMIEGAIDTGFCDIIPHPFVLEKIRDYVDIEAVLDAYDREQLEAVLTKAAHHGVAFELNPQHVKVFPFMKELVALGRRVGCRFSIGSDAHRLPYVGYNHMEGGIEAVGRLMHDIGLEQKDVWEASPL